MSPSAKKQQMQLPTDTYSSRLEPMSVGAPLPHFPYFSTILNDVYHHPVVVTLLSRYHLNEIKLHLQGGHTIAGSSKKKTPPTIIIFTF